MWSSLHRSLLKHGFNVAALHGDMDQRSRTAALDAFRSGEVPLLVASDVAARGLDIPAVSHVFNYDIPHHAEDYVHRIGRTGRAGRRAPRSRWWGPATRNPSRRSRNSSASRSSGKARLSPNVRNPPRHPPKGLRSAGSVQADRPPAGTQGSSREPASESLSKLRLRPSQEPEQAPQSQERAERQPRERGERQRPARGSRKPQQREEVRGRSGARCSARRAFESTAAGGWRAHQFATEPRTGRDRHQGRSDDRPRRHEQDNDAPVLGLGEHVPAFLMRPTAPKKTKSE